MHELFKEFSFDAAHHLGANVESGHIYANIHGHSFTATVFLRGSPNPETGWIVDLSVLQNAITRLHQTLDHRYLNEIEGLEIPTMENICLWIWHRLKPEFPLLARVVLKRGTLGEGCSYQQDT